MYDSISKQILDNFMFIYIKIRDYCLRGALWNLKENLYKIFFNYLSKRQRVMHDIYILNLFWDFPS